MNNEFIARELLEIAGSLVADEVVPGLGKMTLSQIATVVYEDHRQQGRPVDYAAKPYLEAMSSLQHIDDMYLQDTGISIVSYFLSNSSSYKGDVARAIKNELKRRLRG
jgi:hypothetical protein